MNEGRNIIGLPDFEIWTPVETIEKAGGVVDYKSMRLKGIASTEDTDLDDETLTTKGFITDYLLERGLINWHHRSKDRPAAIIGEPEVAEITKAGLYVEGRLYDTPVAREAYDACRMLQKQSKRRRLGWSIEGKVLERDSNDNGLIKKAILTGLALTPAPKNANTFAEVCKAFTSEDYAKQILSKANEEMRQTFLSDEELIFLTPTGRYIVNGNKVRFEKALTAGASRGGERGTGTNLSRESLEGGLVVTTHKPKLLKKIFQKYPSISFEKAIQLYDKLSKQ